MKYHHHQFVYSTALIGLLLLTGCAPAKPETKENAIVVSGTKEIRITDPELARRAANANATKSIIGNISYEVRENSLSRTQKLYIRAAFFNPAKKNPLFENISPGLVESALYPADPDGDDDHDHASPKGKTPGHQPNHSHAPGEEHSDDK